MIRKHRHAAGFYALAASLICAAWIGPSTCTFAADSAPVFDTRSLVQVRWLAGLPSDVRTALGQQKSGTEGIADTWGKFNTDVVDSRLPMRRFIVGGASSTAVLVAYEQGGLARTYHAVGFYLQGAGWTKVAEWTLSEKPRNLGGLTLLVDSGRYPFAARSKRYAHILSTQPDRRDGPLRELNLSDDEVRELQSLALGLFPGSIVNISGVVTGCPCEEGPSCTDQVWIVAHKPGESLGLQFSRIGGRWTVGVVQQWWLEFAKLRSELPGLSVKFFRAEQELDDRFPACVAEGASPTTAVASQPSREMGIAPQN